MIGTKFGDPQTDGRGRFAGFTARQEDLIEELMEDDLCKAEAKRRRRELDEEGVLTKAIGGGAFIFDRPSLAEETLWGVGDRIFWAKGEALMLAASQSLGKTTLLGQVLRARLFGGDVLGLPVAKAQGRVLFLAMDRPKQAARSLARQFLPDEREGLDKWLTFWPGPPPCDLAADPSMLARLADRFDAAEVYVDSLKDAALGLSSDEVGAAYNRGRQTLLASGRELLESHHNIKRNPKGGKPTSIADIYGSAWLTNGCGSVILLTGEPGDLVVGLKHVKPVVEELGPWQLVLDKAGGELRRIGSDDDLFDALKATQEKGVTARQFACTKFQTNKPTPSDIEKARRHLVRWEKEKGLTQWSDSDGVHRWRSYPFAQGSECDGSD